MCKENVMKTKQHFLNVSSVSSSKSNGYISDIKQNSQILIYFGNFSVNLHILQL